MQQITPLIIDALRAGAVASRDPRTEQAVKQAYFQFQRLLADRYAVDLDALENGATTATLQQPLDARLTVVVADKELWERLGTLFASLAQASEGRRVLLDVGVHLEDIKARYLHVQDVVADGTGVQILNSQFDEEVDVSHIRTDATSVRTRADQALVGAQGAQVPLRGEALSATGIEQLPPAVVLTNVQAGGRIRIGPVTQVFKFFVGEPAAGRSARQREAMLHLVEDTWITGFLKPSLLVEARLNLLLEYQPDLVHNRRWEELVQMPQPAPPAFNASADDIVGIFQQSHQSLLILGDPGSGKTTLLLSIAQAMLNAAHRSTEQPIPVVLNLASWSAQTGTLDTWIVSELKEKYLVPANITRQWLLDDDLMVLMDGLDEVHPGHRSECVAAINQFRAKHMVPIAVCSRQAEYELLETKLVLEMAVRICPLNRQQIEEYMHAAHLEQTPLGTLIHSDVQFRDLVRSPLMLYIISMAGEHLTIEALQSNVSVEDWESCLFETYVAAMFRRRSGHHLYSPERTVNWLHWLACQMVAHHQETFLFEQMQPTLLAGKRQHLQYHVSARLVEFLLLLATCSILGVLAGAMRGVPQQGLAAGLNIGMILAMSALAGSIARIWLPSSGAILLSGSLVTIMYGAATGNLREAFLLGLMFGVPGSLAGLPLAGRQPLRPTDTVAWSWSRSVVGLGIGILISVLVGIIIALRSGIEAGISNGWAVSIYLVPAFVVWLGLARADAVQPAIRPNQGMRGSLRTIFGVWGLVALFCILLVAAAVAWGIVYRGSAFKGLAYGLIVGLPVGLIIALVSGGAVLIQHYVLRGILAINGLMPWRCQRFLDYAVERVFLRRIGGGYIFYHRWLMEHFADINEKSDVAQHNSWRRRRTSYPLRLDYLNHVIERGLGPRIPGLGEVEHKPIACVQQAH